MKKIKRKKRYIINIAVILTALLFLQGCANKAEESAASLPLETTEESSQIETTKESIQESSQTVSLSPKTNTESSEILKKEKDQKEANTNPSIPSKESDSAMLNTNLQKKENEKNKEGTKKEETAAATTSANNSSKKDSNLNNFSSSSPSTKPSSQKSAAISSASGALCVNGTQLTDSNGNLVQLKGISTHGLAWFPDYINQDCFQQLHDEWNINVIRLAMYTAEYGGYCNGGNQDSLKDLIKKGVEYATNLNMYVIIDWHILSDNNPNSHIEEAKAFFAEMAESYADYNNVLYEICNEPNGSTSWNNIKSYAQEVISVIRSYDTDGIIIVGTPNWSQAVDQAANDPITDYDNIMYALHFYAATHTDSLRNTMTTAIEAGLPIFVSEYGICDASGNGAIDESQANQWISTMNEYGISYIAWNLSNKNETSAILNNSCSKTSGFTEEDLSASGKWLYHMLTGKTVLNNTNNTAANNTNTTNIESSPSISPETKPSSPAPAETNSQENNSSPENPSLQPSVSFTNNEISYTAELRNSWQSDGKSFYQYELTLQNTSSSDCNAWAIDVSFTDTIALSDSWNGNYSVSDTVLHITNKDYNGSILSGNSINNIGFIISGSQNLQLQN